MLEGLTFDDVLLEPQFSDIESRQDVDISTSLGSINLSVPILSANMDSVTEFKMAIEMHKNGGLGVLHRYTSKEHIKQWLINCNLAGATAIPSIGVKDEDRQIAEFLLQVDKSKSICVDVAHADCLRALEMTKFLVKLGYINIMVGNVATAGATDRLVSAGANIIKVGVGPGSVCTTRIVTGHGVPQLQAIEHCAAVARGAERPIAVVADGGIKSSGDIVKALAAGASAVMLGGLLADTYEAPASVLGEYRGMASDRAQKAFKGNVSNNTPEGVSRKVKKIRNVCEVLDELKGGIRSGLSYSGARNIKQLQKNAVFVKITGNVLAESHPHGLEE